jgi:hypothetical protein
LPASLCSRGPVVWIRPTPLSVKSEALMTRGPRVAPQALRDVLAVLLVRVAAGRVLRVRHRRHQRGHPRPELLGQRRQRGRAGAVRGQFGSVILDRVVQQGGADHVAVAHAVVRHDPDRHPEQVVDVRFPLAAVGGVQPPARARAWFRRRWSASGHASISAANLARRPSSP